MTLDGVAASSCFIGAMRRSFSIVLSSQLARQNLEAAGDGQNQSNAQCEVNTSITIPIILMCALSV